MAAETRLLINYCLHRARIAVRTVSSAFVWTSCEEFLLHPLGIFFLERRCGDISLSMKVALLWDLPPAEVVLSKLQRSQSSRAGSFPRAITAAAGSQQPLCWGTGLGACVRLMKADRKRLSGPDLVSGDCQKGGSLPRHFNTQQSLFLAVS